MSTILRATTCIEDQSILKSFALPIEVKNRTGNTTYFLIQLADRDFEDFNGQVRDCINFLNKYQEALAKVRQTIKDISWEIDFGLNPKIGTPRWATENLNFPNELIKLCAELDIELNITLYNPKIFPS